VEYFVAGDSSREKFQNLVYDVVVAGIDIIEIGRLLN
jgi:tryptophan synthase alpha subunit